jgi:YVTN family beta-propeller protein
VIDAALGTVSTIPAGDAPQALIANPLTNQIYVANQESNTVTVLAEAGASRKSFAVGASPRAMAFNPVTNRVYVANLRGKSVSVIKAD